MYKINGDLEFVVKEFEVNVHLFRILGLLSIRGFDSMVRKFEVKVVQYLGLRAYGNEFEVKLQGCWVFESSSLE